MNKVTNDIYYVGVNDHIVDLFEGQYVVPLPFKVVFLKGVPHLTQGTPSFP